MNKMKMNLLAFTAFLACGSALAHHGTAGSYDENKVVTVKGTVKEFRWRNPHSALFVASRDAAGKDVTYALEMGSPATLVKAGLSRDTFKSGDAIAIAIHPSFTNPASGYAPTSLRAEVNGKLLREGSGNGRGE